MAMLMLGNSKLGQGIWSFSLPARTTCPGKSKSCSRACYAGKGFFRMTTVLKRYRSNLRKTKQLTFLSELRHEMREKGPNLVRYHVSGDFYSVDYAEKFLQLLRAEPMTRFLVYTRSWQEPEIAEVLKLCALEKNCLLWLSADNETGTPPRWKGIAGIAFMALSEADQPSFPVDLVFFVKEPSSMTRFFGGTLVCPNEQNAPNSKEMTCSRCRYCFKRQPRGRWKHKVQEAPRPRRRLALAMA